MAEGDLLRHVLRPHHLRLQAGKLGARAGDVFVDAVAVEAQAGGLKGGGGVLQLVAIGQGDAYGAVSPGRGCVAGTAGDRRGGKREEQRRTPIAVAAGGERRVEHDAQVLLGQVAPVGDEPDGAVEQFVQRREATPSDFAGVLGGDDGEIGVFGRVDFGSAPDGEDAIGGKPEPHGEGLGDVGVFADDAQAADGRPIAHVAVPSGGGDEEGAPAKVEIAQWNDGVRREALRQVFDPLQAADAEVVVAEGDLDGDVLLSEDAHLKAAVALGTEDVGARDAGVLADVEAGGGKERADGLAQIAGGQGETNHDATAFTAEKAASRVSKVASVVSAMRRT